MSNICINNLCGLPAAGKSTFCKKLCHLATLGKFPLNIIYICYDQLITDDMQRERNFKAARFHIKWLIQQSIEQILKGSQQLPISPINTNNTSFMILIDDNMYYRSMRKEIRNIAVLYNIAYFQTYFPISLTAALQRNDDRVCGDKVPEDHLTKMCSKFEEPQKDEGFTLVMDLSANDNDDEPLCEIVLNVCQEQLAANLIKPTEIKSVNPPPPPPQQSSSKLHEIDLMLRKEIGKQIQTTCAKNKVELARNLCERRKFLLMELKMGTIDVPDDINDLKVYIFFE